MTETENSLVTTKYETLPLCTCGCGQPVRKLGNKFIFGHQSRVRTAIRSKSNASSEEGQDVLIQDMEIAQQVLHKVLSGANKGQHTINVITIGQIRVNDSDNGKATKPSIQAHKQEEKPKDISELLNNAYAIAVDLGFLKGSEIECTWLNECNKVLIQKDRENYYEQGKKGNKKASS